MNYRYKQVLRTISCFLGIFVHKISMHLFATGFTKHTKRAGFARCRNSQCAGSDTENHLRRLRKISRTNCSKKCPYILWYIQTISLIFRFSHSRINVTKKSCLGAFWEKALFLTAEGLKTSFQWPKVVFADMYLFRKLGVVFCFGHQECLNWGRGHFGKWKWAFPHSFPGFFSRNQFLSLRMKPVVWMYLNRLEHFFT